ncbi:MAG: polyprenyl synthetase family protein [Candidatus Marsarchaeota archaeon]|jgi:geranylgeranyl pyrophosphate synthase|nr:polyprenyl synthetase family protein [Candidatus Marsarchaeota archaeon]
MAVSGLAFQIMDDILDMTADEKVLGKKRYGDLYEGDYGRGGYKNSENSIITIPEIKRTLPRQVNHRTLMVILEYLEESGKIVVT